VAQPGGTGNRSLLVVLAVVLGVLVLLCAGMVSYGVNSGRSDSAPAGFGVRMVTDGSQAGVGRGDAPGATVPSGGASIAGWYGDPMSEGRQTR
jgi:serine/threonine-protein kinase